MAFLVTMTRSLFLASFLLLFVSVQAFPCGKSYSVYVETVLDRQRQEMLEAFEENDGGKAAVRVADKRVDHPPDYFNAYNEARELYEFAHLKGNSDGANGLGFLYAHGYI